MALPLIQAKNGDKIVGGGLPPVLFSLEGSRGLFLFFIIFCAIDHHHPNRLVLYSKERGLCKILFINTPQILKCSKE
jgi:hypothetical protein